eukprot:570417-Rhodomonas_salina.2
MLMILNWLAQRDAVHSSWSHSASWNRLCSRGRISSCEWLSSSSIETVVRCSSGVRVGIFQIFTASSSCVPDREGK